MTLQLLYSEIPYMRKNLFYFLSVCTVPAPECLFLPSAKSPKLACCPSYWRGSCKQISIQLASSLQTARKQELFEQKSGRRINRCQVLEFLNNLWGLRTE
jgi:hypothetical protein